MDNAREVNYEYISDFSNLKNSGTYVQYIDIKILEGIAIYTKPSCYLEDSFDKDRPYNADLKCVFHCCRILLLFITYQYKERITDRRATVRHTYTYSIIQVVPGRKVNILGGQVICHSKAKNCTRTCLLNRFRNIGIILYTVQTSNTPLSSHELQSALMLTVEF
jgi:hypothetical protein